jgi:hypothetical protein
MLHFREAHFLVELAVLNSREEYMVRTIRLLYCAENQKKLFMKGKSTTFGRVLLTVGLVLSVLNLWGQKNIFWQNAVAEQGEPLTKAIVHSRTVSVNINSLRDYLNTADMTLAGKSIDAITKTIGWAFPLPDGGSIAVKVVRNKTLSDALAAQNPLIKTYTGYNAEGIPCMRLTISPIGVAGFVNTEKGQVYLAPVKGNPSLAISFYTNDLKAISGAIQCGTNELEHIASENTSAKPLGFVDNQMRDYTISIAATGEYTAWAGSQVNALAAITTSINNVNAVYERDLAVHFTLNSPNSILFPDASIDPYSGTSSLSGTQLNQNQTAVDLAIGNANYDLSVVYNAGWSGGLAQLSSTCNSTGKARSAAGLDPANFPTGPSGPVFDMTVAHEIGHQFSATHSFSANTGGCSGNVTGTTAWEPGGGSTIMAYAGTCTGLAYQSNSDSYFHGGNLGQMSVFLLTGTGSSCATLSPLGNALPLLNKIAYSYTIPRNTPFKLRAPAADANSTDVLTYCWEQLNPFGGTGTNALPSATATSGPLFRSFPPTTAQTRYFPNLQDYASGTATPFEVLPNTTRTMNFLLTVRDNHTGAGATDTQNITINVSTCGSFSITSHAVASAAAGGSSTTLTWNTASACVTCNNIDILFSKDGGKTFPYTVLSGTPNDGSESVTIPNINTCDGRFMIACSDNIFYNINSGAITVSTSCIADGTTITPVTSVSATSGSASLNLTMNPVYGAALATPIAGSITTANASSSVAVLNNGSPCINYNGNAVRYTTYTITPSITGSYTFNAGSSTFGLVYSLYNNEYLPDAPCQNMITSSGNSTGSGVALGSSITATLCAQKTYVLLVSSFDNTFPVLPAPYSIAVSGPAGFALYNGVPPPTGYNYMYLVNNSVGNIVQIVNSPDLSNSTTYPTGNYTIYGVSTNATAATLNTTYGGGSFGAFNTAANNGTICANISANSRSVQVSTPLPLDLTGFSAKLLSLTSAGIIWKIAKENNIAKYELERSYDAMAFEKITTVLPGISDNTAASYSYTDDKFNRSENQLFYRLRISEKEGQVKYSNIEKLVLDRTKDFSLQVIPNPVQGKDVRFNLSIPQSGVYGVNIIDETGRVLHVKTQSFATGVNHCTIPAENLSSGIYYLKVQGVNGVLNARFVKL